MRSGRHRVSMLSSIFEEKKYACSFCCRGMNEHIFAGIPGYKSAWNTTDFRGHIWLALACPDGG